MFFHWNNESQDERAGAPKVWPRHGRCWLHLREPWCLGLEWKIFSGELAGGFWCWADEPRVVLRVSFLLATLYFSIDVPYSWTTRILPGEIVQGRDGPFEFSEDREFAWAIRGWTLWWCWWMHPHEWSSREPWYRRGSFAPIRLLFGPQRHQEHPVERRSVFVAMLEGDYEATATLSISTWKRPRWPWWPSAFSVSRVTVEIPHGIPKPGKGENSWDQGDDACFSLTSPARTIEAGVAAVAEHVNTARRRHGSADWVPRPTPRHAIC